MKKVSVVLPAYNTEKYVRQCLESVLNQTYKNIELIVVNDGSSDGTLQICEQYRLKDPRVRLISQENQGLSGARNTGINAAGGEYLFFVDADDWLVPHCLERLVQVQEETGSNICITDFAHFETEKSLFIFYGKKERFGIYSYTSEEWLHLVQGPDQGRVHSCAWGKLYDRKIFETLRYPLRKISEDDYTTYKAYLLADTITYVFEEPLYIYRKSTPGSIMTTHCRMDTYPVYSLEEAISLMHLLHMDVSAHEKLYRERLASHGPDVLSEGRLEEFRREQFIKSLLMKTETKL